MNKIGNLPAATAESFPPVLVIGLFTVCYLIYWTVFSRGKGRLRDLVFSRLFGAVFLGIIPLFLFTSLTSYTLDEMGFSIPLGKGLFTVIAAFVLSLAAVGVNALNAGNPRNLHKYPQIREPEWDRRTLLLNIFTWILYLTGYEILFRSVLLFPLADIWGVWPAVAVNTALYSATHIPKGLDEAYGALFMGTVLSVLTIMSGSIWIAVAVHIALGLSNSLFALKAHGSIRYSGVKK